MIDVLIQTLNEELNLPHALQSVKGWANRVFVVDSGSTDRTIEIARQSGATVVEHPWEGYARQKNWAIDNLPFESPWIFILDADEAVTPALRDELLSICGKPADEVVEAGFYVNRYLIFMGHRIRHCGYFPSWNLRLFKRGRAHYEDRPVHEHMLVNGREGYLKGLLEHEDRRGLEYYIAKHNRYSTLEAETIFYTQRNGSLRPDLFGSAVERRRFFKSKIYPKLPAKWLGRFVWMYFIQLGLLDGMAGLRFCLLISSHELFTSLKLRELQERVRGNKPDRAHYRDTSTMQMFERPHIPAPAPAPAAARPSAAARGRMPAASGSSISSPQIRTLPPAPDNGRHVIEPSRELSPWTLAEKIKRVLWMVTWRLLFRPSFHNWYNWRAMLLRMFGARIGHDVRIRPTATVEIPWNLEIGDNSVVGDFAILYSLGKIRIGRLVTISQYAHLCAGTHDYRQRHFPLLRPPITIEDEAWIAADAFVEHPADAEAHVEADEVGQLQRPHRVVEPKACTRVDVLGGAQPLLVRANSFGQERHQDAVDDEARPVGRPDDLLAQIIREPSNRPLRLVRRG
jgi:glycosyltransferase involved in cell wall biosynthesis